MVSATIVFKTPDDVANFVRKVSKYDIDVDIKKGTALLDGKSLEGLYALQLNTELTCIVHENMENATKIIEDINEFTKSSFAECK